MTTEDLTIKHSPLCGSSFYGSVFRRKLEPIYYCCTRPMPFFPNEWEVSHGCVAICWYKTTKADPHDAPEYLEIRTVWAGGFNNYIWNIALLYGSVGPFCTALQMVWFVVARDIGVSTFLEHLFCNWWRVMESINKAPVLQPMWCSTVQQGDH